MFGGFSFCGVCTAGQKISSSSCSLSFGSCIFSAIGRLLLLSFLVGGLMLVGGTGTGLLVFGRFLLKCCLFDRNGHV